MNNLDGMQIMPENDAIWSTVQMRIFQIHHAESQKGLARNTNSHEFFCLFLN